MLGTRRLIGTARISLKPVPAIDGRMPFQRQNLAKYAVMLMTGLGHRPC
jgi:hypothetical protein